MAIENTEDIVAKAFADAEAADEPVVEDDVEEETSGTTGDEPTEGTEEASAEGDEAEVEHAEAAPDPNADVIKLLSEHGLKGLALNDKLPTPRARKIVYNAIRKLLDKHAGELKTRDEQAVPIRTAAEAANRWNQLVINPELTISELAKIHPTLWGPIVERLKGAATAPTAAKPALPAASDDPEPQPDRKAEDGSWVEYSPEQWGRHQQWVIREATRQAKAGVEETLKPLRDREAAQTSYNARVEAYKQATKELTEDYGDEFANEAVQAQILATMKERGWNGVEALRRTAGLVITANRNKTRDQQEAEWRKKLKTAPAAAKHTPGSGGGTGLKKAGAGSGPRETADIVAEAFAEAER